MAKSIDPSEIIIQFFLNSSINNFVRNILFIYKKKQLICHNFKYFFNDKNATFLFFSIKYSNNKFISIIHSANNQLISHRVAVCLRPFLALRNHRDGVVRKDK